jgi:16S rRNA (cytidine1402-2'-O)-methyltransferase
MAGTLFVVATPIGNLEDITLRALRTLREVDLIAAEDTRRTAKLLAHYQIQRPMVSLHEHNEYREAPKIIERVARGVSVALVSDAGTPGISDPGQHLVRVAHERGIKVTPIPGPSAVMAALSVSGQPASEFVFMGFPPRGGRARTQWMARVRAEKRTIVAFEAPHRIGTVISELTLLVNRQIIILREATKLHEQLAISPTNITEQAMPRLGEFVIVIGASQHGDRDEHGEASRLALATRLVGCMTTSDDFELDEAITLAAVAAGLQNEAVKKAWKKHRILENRRAERLS